MMKKLKEILRMLWPKDERTEAQKNAPQKAAKAVDMAPALTAKIPTPLQEAQERIMNERIKRYEEKAEVLGKNYQERLNQHLQTYFNNFSDDVETNEFAYNLINKEWKAYVLKANASQNLLRLKVESFEKEVERIVSENPQFQLKEVEPAVEPHNIL